MNHSELLQSKIFTDFNSIELIRLLSFWKFKSKKIVFTNGCFDILHKGHIEYLANAAGAGDILVVGLNSDDSVSRLKGKNRPLQNQDSRSLVLASLSFVNAVIVFEEDTPLELIKTVKPDVLVKGADYKINDIAGADIVTAYGGVVMTVGFIEGYSSSSIINKLQPK